MRKSHLLDAISFGLATVCIIISSDISVASNPIVSANSEFGFKLYKNLAKNDGDRNIVISPLSLAIALTMTYNGADGDTKAAMAETLAIQGISLDDLNNANAGLINELKNLDKGIQLIIANSLWANKNINFKQKFLNSNRDFYDSEIKNIDFNDPASADTINAWVSEKTHEKINKMITDDLGDDTVAIILSTSYFNGRWSVAFNKENTIELDFILVDGNKKKIPMMSDESKRFRVFEGDGFEAVSIPYGDGKANIYIFVPNHGSSLKEFNEKLSAENWNSWIPQFKNDKITLLMPRFKASYEVQLNSVLEALGMGIAFGSNADFGNMCNEPAFISQIRHKSFMEVNEEGTEASSGAIVQLKKGGGAIYVNRPFFFAIRDENTGSILFMGSIAEP